MSTTDEIWFSCKEFPGYVNYMVIIKLETGDAICYFYRLNSLYYFFCSRLKLTFIQWQSEADHLKQHITGYICKDWLEMIKIPHSLQFRTAQWTMHYYSGQYRKPDFCSIHLPAVVIVFSLTVMIKQW